MPHLMYNDKALWVFFSCWGAGRQPGKQKDEIRLSNRIHSFALLHMTQTQTQTLAEIYNCK